MKVKVKVGKAFLVKGQGSRIKVNDQVQGQRSRKVKGQISR